MAARSQLTRQGTLGEQAGERLRIVDLPHGVGDERVIGAPLEGEDPLPRGRDEALGVEHRPDLGLPVEALKAGARQDDRIELALGELAQAGIDVPPKRRHLEILARAAQLRKAANAARADACAGAQLIQSAHPAQDVLDTGARGSPQQ